MSEHVSSCNRERKQGIRRLEQVLAIRRALPCSSMSGTKFSIGLGDRGAKALCGKATSCGQSSTEGTPTTLWGDTSHNQQQAQLRHTCGCFICKKQRLFLSAFFFPIFFIARAKSLNG